MDPMGDRSKDVTTASTATLPATAVRALDFDALYRDARDDVFAYTATLLRRARRRAAAELESERTLTIVVRGALLLIGLPANALLSYAAARRIVHETRQARD